MISHGVQNDLAIGPLGPIFNTPLKVAQIRNWHVNQDYCETSGIFFYKMKKKKTHEIFTYLGT